MTSITHHDETFLMHSIGDWSATDAAEEMADRLEELGFTELTIDAVFVDDQAVLFNVENDAGVAVSFLFYLDDISDPTDPSTEGMVVPMAAIINPDDEGEFMEIDLSDLDVEIDDDCPLAIPDVFDLSWMNKSLAKALLSSDFAAVVEGAASDVARSRGGKIMKTDQGFFKKLPMHKKTTEDSKNKSLYKKCCMIPPLQGWSA